MKQLHFITFAAGSDSYSKALKRIALQAKKTDMFDTVSTFDESWLIEQKEFWNKHKNFINDNKNQKGFGFYMWKPYVIKYLFDTINEGDVLLWCDAGCEISSGYNGPKFKKALIEEANKYNFLALETNSKLHYQNFTKGDVYTYFNTTLEEMLNLGCYYETNRLFFAKNSLTSKIVNDWYEIMSNNYYLFDHSESKNKNPEGFIQSRHDQMILNFVFYKNNELNKSHVLHNLISPFFRAYRSRGGKSRLCERFDTCVCDCCVA